MEPIIQILDSSLSNEELLVEKEYYETIFQIMMSISTYSEPYLQKLIPCLCRLFSVQPSLQNTHKIEVVNKSFGVLKLLIRKCVNGTVQFLNLLVATFIKLLEECVSVGKEWNTLVGPIMELFVLFLITFKSDFLIYLPFPLFAPLITLFLFLSPLSSFQN